MYEKNLFNKPDLDRRVAFVKNKANIATNQCLSDGSKNGLPIVKVFLDETLPELHNIKCTGEVKVWIEVGDIIALTASGIIKSVVQFLGFLAHHAKEFRSNQQVVNDAKNELIEAARLMNIITKIYVSYDVRQLLNKVNVAITDAEKKVSANSGCFIATFAFDDYNSTEVLFLRNYRDVVLSKSSLGRTFISTYYLISPTIVQILRKIPKSKQTTQQLLNLIIKKLKKWQQH